MHYVREWTRRFIVFALSGLARAAVVKYRPRLIIVTGGVGKTLTKDAAYAALSSSYFVRRSEKSYNSDIGVPLTVLGLPNAWNNPLRWLKNFAEGALLVFSEVPYPEWLVVEVGADRPGDITRALSWLRPDVVVTTRFPDMPAHVEFYESPQAVIAEELAPAGWLKEGGALIENADDAPAPAALVHPGVRRFSYGFSPNAFVRGGRLRALSKNGMPAGISFDVSCGNERAHVSLPGVLGVQHVYPLLAGISAALAAGATLEKAVSDFGAYLPPPGRMRLLPGMRGSVLIDDSYNASPAAVIEALAALKDTPRKGKRIAILADMLELGSFSVEAHERIGAAAAASADVLVTVGIRAKGIAQKAREAGMDDTRIFECEKTAEAAAKATSIIEEGDVVLVKGSQAMRMERVVKSLVAEPRLAKELLVRQEKEWLAR